MKLSQLTKGVALRTALTEDIDILGIAYDSRLVRPGYLFVCIKGFQTDGHAYIESAIEKGAAAVLVQDEVLPLSIPCLKAADTRIALAQVAANFYGHPEKELSIIGVTGTNGKTTVTTLIKAVLEFDGSSCGLIGTNHNMIGDTIIPTERTTPESLELFALFRQMVDAGCSYVIMEVSSHSLVLHRVEGISFRVGVFTNLTQDHLDFHGTMDQYFEAKKLLFNQSEIGVYNADDTFGKTLCEKMPCPMISYGVENPADFRGENLRISPRGVLFDVKKEEKVMPARLNIPGKFSVYNALAAIGALSALGISTETILDALTVAPGVKGRAETVYTGTDFTVIIDYAHTPDGLENIISTVKEFTTGRVITLFGCGGDRDPIKRPIMGEIAGRLSDYCIITSDNPRTEDPGAIIKQIELGMKRTDCTYTVIENRRDAICHALEIGKADDCIILAGKGHETYQIIGKEKRHFDEREVISELLATMPDKVKN